MANYSFIINVGNAIDKSHFRMYFHESISTRRLSLYDIEDFSELEEKVSAIGKHIDRNVFEADSNYLYICTTRKWQNQTDLQWWKLFQKSFVYSAIPEEIQKKLKNIYLIIVDYDDSSYASESGKINKIEKELLEKGFLEDESYLSNWDLSSHPVITKEQLTAVGNMFLKDEFKENLDDIFDRNTCGSVYCDFVAETINHFRELSVFMEQPANDAEGTTTVYSFADTFKRDFQEKLSKKLDKIDTLLVKIDPNDLAEKRLFQLRLVTFLLKAATQDNIQNITKAFQQYDNSFDPVTEALKLKKFSERMDDQARKLEQRKDDPKLEFTYREIKSVSPLTEEKLIGNEDDISRTLTKVMGFRNRENWDKEFEELLDEIALYEDQLKDYGKEVNKEFHKNKNDNIDEKTASYDNDNLAVSEIEKEIELANENAYKERDKGDNTFATIVDITNQFNIVGSCLKKLNAARMAASKTNFARILLFVALMIIVPYSIMQTYIYAGLLKGNLMPVICVVVLLLAVILARPVAVAALDRSFKKEVKRLQELVQRYFDGIQQRQILFHDGVNSMIDIWNAQQKYDACQEAIATKREEHQRLDYHKNALKNFRSVMKYFDSFIDSYYDEDCSYTLQTEKDRLDREKNVTDNRIYWIDRAVEAAE